jgi:ketosteroid isomerase-like protein
MSERARNTELVERAFAAFRTGDVDTVNSFLDPGVEVVISDRLANSGRWSGVDGFWESIGGWLEAWDEWNIELRGTETPDDRHVIAETLQTATGRASGVPVELTAFFLFELRDGRAIRHELHPSRDDALAAVAPH